MRAGSTEAGLERSEARGRREQAAVYRGQKTGLSPNSACPPIVQIVVRKPKGEP